MEVDLKNLKTALANLSIRQFQGPDGRHTVISDSEPCFCFVRDTEAEVEGLVVEILQDYAQRFHKADISIQLENIVAEPVQIVRLKQRSTLRPTFGFGGVLDSCVPA